MQKNQSFEVEARWGGIIFAIFLFITAYFFGEFKFFKIRIGKSFDDFLFFLLGAFVSACMVKEFSIKISPARELIKGILGGVLFALGVLFLSGGTLYTLYFHLSHFTLAALLGALGIVPGLFLGAKYQAWEVEKKASPGGIEIRLPRLNPLLALIGAASLLILAYKDSFYLLLFALLGIVAERSRLCLSISSREFFFSGRASVSQGIILSIALFALAVFFYKHYQTWEVHILKEPAWWISLLGGILMGFSIILMEADGISLLWKTGEGRVKALFSLLAIIFCLKIFEIFRINKILSSIETQAIYLKTWLGPFGGPGIVIIISALFYLLTWYNSKTKKWVKPML